MVKQITSSLDDEEFARKYASVEDIIMDGNINFNNPEDIQKLYDTRGQGTTYALTHRIRPPGMKDIADLVGQINATQKSLDVIKRMDVSPIYRAGVQIGDYVMKLFGAKVTKRDILDNFIEQQQSVARLNRTLARRVQYFQRELTDCSQRLTERIEEQNGYITDKLESQDNIQSLVGKRDALKAMLAQIDRKQQPLQYNQVLQQFRSIDSEYLDARASWERSAYVNEQMSDTVDRQLKRERIFKKELQNTMMLSERTMMYQRELDDTISHWVAARDLGEGVTHLKRGVQSLGAYAHEMNATMEQYVHELASAFRSEPLNDGGYESDLLDGLDAELEELSAERATRYAR